MLWINPKEDRPSRQGPPESMVRPDLDLPAKLSTKCGQVPSALLASSQSAARESSIMSSSVLTSSLLTDSAIAVVHYYSELVLNSSSNSALGSGTRSTLLLIAANSRTRIRHRPRIFTSSERQKRNMTWMDFQKRIRTIKPQG